MRCGGTAESDERGREGWLVSILDIGDREDAADAAAEAGDWSGSAGFFGLGLECAGGVELAGDMVECKIDRALGAA